MEFLVCLWAKGSQSWFQGFLAVLIHIYEVMSCGPGLRENTKK